MKRILSLVLALILCTSLAVPALAADFSDVPPSHNFYPAVADCSSKGIAGGYPDGTFRPSATVTRSNFCVMLSRAFYPSDITRYTNDFTTSFGSFYPNYLALANNGIWNNVSFDEEYIYTSDFAASMNLGISRYDMAQLMTNIMNARGFAAGEAEKNAAASKITDYSSIPGQYRDAVANVYALGVIGGYSDGSFNGGGVMNRGQAAAVIYRMTQAVPVEVPAPETPAVPAPETPEAPAPETPSTSAAGTLTNGKPITVENVTELMNELRAQYPNKTDAGRYSGPAAIRQITTKYSVDTGGLVSTSIGCGGWAARVFNYIFGQDVTFRRVSYDEARIGDLLIKVDSQGYLAHVAIVSARKTVNGIPNMLCTTDANYGGGTNVMTWDLGRDDPIDYNDPWTYDIYTVYPN
ncbi:S-layer homology domain-containing protein [uncultured Oscillibacter sp.]|uniref:S-layer homology domain-containing protein n=1 Tax=uncultured Oscillibacter sp. TaxID=876091 RepID=UPI00272C9B4A|nr:S-layer homology domain-containing protein [uncultured Oscillibacter sp.]